MKENEDESVFLFRRLVNSFIRLKITYYMAYEKHVSMFSYIT